MPFQPIPASKNLPDWFKKTESYLANQKTDGYGKTQGTIKKCMPVFDILTSGYQIPTVSDVYVTVVDGVQHFEWADWEMIELHAPWQTLNHPKTDNSTTTPKFKNYWTVETPKGYSSLIMPIPHANQPFEILSGFVDTDSYIKPINFPFIMKDKTWEGLIPAGTFVATIIPVKRETWEMSLGDDKDRQRVLKESMHFGTFIYGFYKKLRWHKKEYK